MVTIDVGATSMLTITPGELKPGWDTDKGLEYCKGIGDQFIKDAKFLMLKVPSAILPIEWNILINPKHPLIKEVSLTKNIPIAIDPRLKSPS
jgi:RES domain-containing protein